MTNPLSALAVASSSSFLTGLEEPALRAILARAKIRRISAKDKIVTSGQQATHLFLVQSGWVQYYHLTKDGESVLLAWMGQGDVVGLTAMLNGPSTLYGNRGSDLRLRTVGLGALGHTATGV
jgi:CRP-like cAMP-binding protein